MPVQRFFGKIKEEVEPHLQAYSRSEAAHCRYGNSQDETRRTRGDSVLNKALWTQAFPDQVSKPRKPWKSIAKVSAHQAQVNKEYSKERKEHLKRYPLCRICGAEATQVHHIKPRSVAHTLTIDQNNFQSTCFACHNWIHNNPKLAYERGYLKKSYDH